MMETRTSDPKESVMGRLPEIHTLRVSAPEAGQRLDVYLTRALAEVSRTRVRTLIDEQAVLVNDRPSKPSYKVRAGDRIEVELPPPPVLTVNPEPLPLTIVYEDEDMLVVEKPAGMVVHPGAGVSGGTLANALCFHVRNLPARGEATRPGIVHRLDRETSGLLVVAKTGRAHDALAEQFARREVRKFYLALVIGRVAEREGRIAAPIGRHPTHRTMMAVRPDGHGREALTLYRVREWIGDFSLLEVEPRTGRTHQIRVHMTWIGHPVVGDAVYGRALWTKVKDSALRQAMAELGRHFLHAYRLCFRHPRSGEMLDLTSPLPEELEAFLALARARAESETPR
jgi:23S rRNA pseudouridine1911/1915/1917 synthase